MGAPPSRRRRPAARMSRREARLLGRLAGYTRSSKSLPNDVQANGLEMEWLRGYEEGLRYWQECREEDGEDGAGRNRPEE